MMTKPERSAGRAPRHDTPTIPQLRDKAASLLDKAKHDRERATKPN